MRIPTELNSRNHLEEIEKKLDRPFLKRHTIKRIGNQSNSKQQIKSMTIINEPNLYYSEFNNSDHNVTLKSAAEFVSDYFANAKAVNIVDILANNFGINIRLDDDYTAIHLDDKEIDDIEFDSFINEFVENLSVADIVALYSSMTGVNFELSENGDSLIEVK